MIVWLCGNYCTIYATGMSLKTIQSQMINAIAWARKLLLVMFFFCQQWGKMICSLVYVRLKWQTTQIMSIVSGKKIQTFLASLHLYFRLFLIGNDGRRLMKTLKNKNYCSRDKWIRQKKNTTAVEFHITLFLLSTNAIVRFNLLWKGKWSRQIEVEKKKRVETL